MNLSTIIFATICTLCLSIAPIFMKKLSIETSSINAVFIITLFTLILATIGLFLFETKDSVVQSWTNETILLFASIVAVVFFIEALAYVKALQTGVGIGILLVYIRTGAMMITPILGILIFQEKITPWQWVGIGLATISIFFILLGGEKTK
jgi:drug/metabolite transporter (DMT)-like permease